MNTHHSTRLLGKVTCPHCWNEFPPENTLWIASDHPSLRDDPKIPDSPRRFPAERFSIAGEAIDACGERCAALACPECHLEVPRVSYEFPPLFISIVGAPACGKSFFLPAMTWTLRNSLPRRFGIEFLDADPRFNLKLHEYEQSLFLNPRRDNLVTIEKTDPRGGQEGLCDRILLGGKSVTLPRPFVFRMQASDSHPLAAHRSASARTVCFYDNAGELYLPTAGAEFADNFRATDHLGRSHLTMFLFDPTQDMRYRDACRGKSQDPQMEARNSSLERETNVLQHTILINATARMKRLRGLAESARHRGPLVVVVTKLDAWMALFPNPEKLLRTPLLAMIKPALPQASETLALSPAAVATVSNAVRTILLKYSPEIVSAAEGFSSDVTYLPCSATGHNVKRTSNDASNAAFGVRPRDVKPLWCDLPFLVGMAKNGLELLPLTSRAPLPNETRETGQTTMDNTA